MKDFRYLVLGVEQFSPATGWWRFIESRDADGEVDSYFEPIVGFAVTSLQDWKTKSARKAVLAVTVEELRQLSYDAVTGEGGVYAADLVPSMYHDSDFEIVGQKLRVGAQVRGA